MTYIVGMSWNYNEGDILEEVLVDAIRHVDALFIADGGSTDNSWDIIQSVKARFPDKVAGIQQEDERHDRAQRNSLLNKIRQAFPVDDTWVQIVESDTFILDTDIRKAIEGKEFAVTWDMWNACRPVGDWADYDRYPNWQGMSIREAMPYAHYMERVLYTFRPLPKLYFKQDPWRPWPVNFGKYSTGPVKIADRTPQRPLILHVGNRGPSHFHAKFKKYGKRHPRYRDWRVGSVEAVERTVAFYNGAWNTNPRPASRLGICGVPNE